MQHIRRLAMLSLCITHITPTFAAGRDFSTDELLALSLEDLTQVQVSIATGTPKSSYSAPAVTSVIDAKTIADLGLQSIDEALQTLPNVHVSRGSFQYAPRYFIRGIASTYNPHTLVLVNGIPMTSLFLGDRGERIPNAYSLPIELVDRIEVIRGAGSALYGADAFAGVINIHTKNPRDIKNNQASLTVGSFATGRANLLQRQQWQDNSALLSLNYYQSDGDSPIIQRDIQSNYDELFQPYPAQSLAPAAASLSARYFNAHLDLQAPNYRLRSAWLKAWNTGTGVGINDNLDPDARFNHHRASFDLNWQGGHYLGWQLSPQLSYLYGDYENPSSIYLFPKGAFAGLFPDGMIGQPSVKEENARFHLSALTEQLPDHRVSIGTGFYWGDLFESHDINNYYFEGAIPKLRPNFKDTSDTADIFQPEAQRTSFFIFAQDEWLINPNWELTSGLRYDHYSDFGDTVNPRLALVWHTHSTLTTKLLYGRAFRAPAFFELYGKNNPVALGNPNLSPEVLTSKELAFAWRPSKKLHIDWNFYQFHIHDYIDFINDAGQQTFSAQNVGRIVGQGFETEWRYQGLNQIQILFNYSHQDTKNKNTHQPQGGVPVDKFYVRGLWDIPLGWQVSGQLTREGKSKRSAGDDREALAAYTTLDVNIKHVWSNDYESSLTVRNVFDADIKEASRGPSPNQTKASLSDDVPQQGRSISVNLKLNW